MVEHEVFESFPLQPEREFYYCQFKNIERQKIDLSDFEFVGCQFENCDLSMAKVEGTLLSDIQFTNCRMMGIDYSGCSKYMFAVSFINCNLNYSFFQKNDLTRTQFRGCQIREAQFNNSDLKSVNFIKCDLLDTAFDRCNLEQSDFTSALNYAFIPSENRVKGAKFSNPEVLGLLQHLTITIV